MHGNWGAQGAARGGCVTLALRALRTQGTPHAASTRLVEPVSRRSVRSVVS